MSSAFQVQCSLARVRESLWQAWCPSMLSPRCDILEGTHQRRHPWLCFPQTQTWAEGHGRPGWQPRFCLGLSGDGCKHLTPVSVGGAGDTGYLLVPWGLRCFRLCPRVGEGAPRKVVPPEMPSLEMEVGVVTGK